MSQPAGVIHDLGYQRYRGTRLGRRHVFGALFLHSLRTAYGLGRSAKAKVFPWLVAGFVGVVAVVVVAARAAFGEQLLGYLEFPDAMFPLLLLFGAVAAPELASRDLRNGILPLYFSRPLRPTDYALAKLAALVGALWLLLAGPLLLMFVGGAFSVGELGAAWGEAGDLLAGLAYAALHAVVVGTLALLIASLITRRAVAAAAIVGAFLVTLPMVGLLGPGDGHPPAGQTAADLVGIANPATLLDGLRTWLFDGGDAAVGVWYAVAAVVLIGGGAGLSMWRYRRLAR